MLVSVIIPTLNRSSYIADAIRSVLGGSYTRFELIVVDQSSDASTRDALAPYMSDRRLRYLVTPRRGTSAARNLGIAASNGDLIAFTDDDVEARSNWLALIVDEFTADPDLQLLCGALIAPPHDTSRGFVPEFRPPPTTSARQLPLFAANANMSMRRSFFDRVGYYDELCGPGGLLKSSDDGDITLRAVRAGVKWKVTPSIEVLHTHGFRPHEAAGRLLEDYEYGNGAIYGRALRRGDLAAGALFILREMRQLARGRRRTTRTRGFWHGLRLPPEQGMISASELRQRASVRHPRPAARLSAE